MLLRAVFTLISLMLLVVAVPSQGVDNTNQEVINIDLCEVINNPRAYDKKLIRTSAIYYSDYHGSGIYGYRCNNPDASIVVSGDEKSSKYKTKRSVLRKYENLINNAKDNASRIAHATIVGIFHDWDGVGYGYGNWTRFQFNIFAFESIGRVKTPIQWPIGESEFMNDVNLLRRLNIDWN